MTSPAETNESLLIRVRDPGDQAAWDQFDAIYRPVAYRIARRAGWQDSDADDLAQRVMMSVAKAIPDWEKDPRKGGFRGWLNRVARNALISMLRSRRCDAAIGGSDFLERSLTVETPTDEIDRLIDQEYHRSRLRWAAEQVRHEFQEQSWRAFWLTTIGELTVLEAAQKLSMSTGAVYAVRSRIMRRLQKLAQSCDPSGEENGRE